jgi:hypothetical protein
MPKQQTGRAARRLLFALLALFLLTAGRAVALPVFSRKYNVPCQTCHIVVPRLNTFGLAFQANHFNWPGGAPGGKKTWLQSIPLSGMATFSKEDSQAGGTASFKFRTLQVFASDGFILDKERQGGYFVDWLAAAEFKAGNLDNAFVSLPVAGPRGEFAVTAGQLTPMRFQWDKINSLTRSLPVAIANDIDAFSFAAANPAIRLDYYSRRNQTTADGDYASVGIPFEGHLTLNDDSRLYSQTHGIYGNAFRRWGYTSAGVYGYSHSGSYLGGILATHALLENRLFLLGAVAGGHDELTGDTRRLSLEAEYALNEVLAFTGRWEFLGGDPGSENYPVGAVTYSPFRNFQFLRLTLETAQQKGNRSVAGIARIQF